MNPRPSSCCSVVWLDMKDTLEDVLDIVRVYPLATLLLPLLVFALLTGFGVWGVIAGANTYAEQHKNDVRSRAVDAATGFQIQLQQSFTPGVTMQMLVKQRPDWEYWVQNFNSTAAELMSRVPKGALWDLQLQPFAQVMLIAPLRPEDLSQINPPRDLIGDPTRRDDIYKIIRTRQPGVNGPFWLVQGFTGAFVRYPIFVPDVSEEETFGFRYKDNSTAIPYSGLPTSVRTCSICYNATTREKWWGLLTVLVNYDEVTNGQDAYLATLRKLNYHYALVRPINSTSEQVIAQVGPTSLRDEDAVTVEVRVLNAVWQLRVAMAGGFKPVWEGPVIAAVVIMSFVVSTLLFITAVSLKRQRLLLWESLDTNYQLTTVTQRLEEEKERRDVLLVRQYDLLRCLDANLLANRNDRQPNGGDASRRLSSDVLASDDSRKSIMSRIEEARRGLQSQNVSAAEETIQLLELLGSGAFGKVQRGLWRGTVVAVKTMILPANMTGQEKREKMAVMEAAISSSLVHPNIVTTYTYFIRPYHEPEHEGIQNMQIGPGPGQTTLDSAFSSRGASAVRAGSGDTQTSIHSYEVRLVLEFCDKGSLKDALDQHVFMQSGSLNLAAMLETAADVAKAMVHMHAANVLHSDLKARNIMLKSSGTEGRGIVAKVADFGLSTRMEHQETHLSSCFQGTLTHMAPEVMLEGRISKAADVYSFGILLWELFCAGDPFQGVPRAHLGHAITKEARRPKFPPFAPAGFVRLATRCWDPDASLRPTFEEVLSELVRMREELGGDTPQLVVARLQRTPSADQNAVNRESPRLPPVDHRSSTRYNQQQQQQQQQQPGKQSLDPPSPFAAHPSGGGSTGASAGASPAVVAAAVAAGGSLGGVRKGRFVRWSNGAVSSPLPLHCAALGASVSSAGSHSACELGQAGHIEVKIPWVRRSHSDGGEGEESGDDALQGEAVGSCIMGGTGHPPDVLGAGCSLGHRPQGKGPLVQRRLRKMGIQLGGPAATSMTPTLPSLDEHADEETLISNAAAKDVLDIVRVYPLATLLLPLLVFALLTGFGVWGVIAGANTYAEQHKNDVRSRAVDAATGFQIQLQQSFTPGVTMQMLVKQRPDWEYWVQNFNSTAAELMSRVPKGALWNLQLQPFAQVMMIHPFRPEDLSQVSPPRDLIGDPARRDPVLQAIRTAQPEVAGPLRVGQGFMGAFVRYPIFVPDVSEEETFGFRYKDNSTAIPYSGLPTSVRNCGICYNATTREKWWGLLTVLVNYDEVTNGQDAYLATLRKLNYYYALVRPINSTSEQVIAQVGPTSLRDEDAVTVEVRVLNAVWQLRVTMADGFRPSWEGPVIAAVVILAFVVSTLLCITAVSLKKQRLLLRESMETNQKLVTATQRLEEEKERMDVLLVRQYDLLRCLDANLPPSRSELRRQGSSSEAPPGRSVSFSALSASDSRKDMLRRIEEARRSLQSQNVSLTEDPIQLLEVLGCGAFGKVQRGLWRGTVVAVKTMILPANMTGQEKREKMAVMEAAISSSLVHPNIVTTYTYFIRPYHEPEHEGIQNMQIGPGPGQTTLDSAFSSRGASAVRAGSGDTQTSIHSYEVRLVLEFCDKGSLKDALDQHVFMQSGSLNLAAMLETAADVAKAMVHMHAANVLHSDLKARNIMLKSSGTEGRGIVAKVADFGLSTRMEHQETHLSSCFQGTLTHMAPEVMLEGRISKAADVYSFGILLWELFCAGDPFQGVPRAHLGHAITKEARRPKFPPFAPAGFVRLATRCWDPDASLRPTFEEVLSELVRMREELGGDTPQLVVTPPKPVRPRLAFAGAVDEARAYSYSAGEGEGGAADLKRTLSDGVDGDGSSDPPSVDACLSTGGGLIPFELLSTTGGSRGRRPQGKGPQVQRRLRKMGIQLGGPAATSMTPTLPALDEHTDEEAC
ncbi:hypothetical protein HYH02_010782 [Chlamydomonas schloesseri]|uniref:Protein kinase domain-containing protein n=1 Tax=Chlamydomonas schloesseri TaxID=2026947 RepID=A0A835T7R1_9CHLO|nr:hypothetical protein HYH02_010782 [Chlamydomonas schloesseri]|eukprot:KAG2438991.1 hypothetical protein HYH02_010782 [Chlamydomonas schloesseri]